MRMTAVNRGPDAAELHLLPTLWFRNDWSAWMRNPTDTEQNQHQADPGAAGRVRSRQHSRNWVSSSCAAKARCRCCLRKTRRTTSGSSRGQDREPLRQGWHQRLRRRWQSGRSEPGPTGHQGRGALPPSIPAGQIATIRLRLSGAAPRAGEANACGHASEEIFGSGRRWRPMISIVRSHRRPYLPMPPTSCVRGSPACSGANSSTISTVRIG